MDHVQQARDRLRRTEQLVDVLVRALSTRRIPLDAEETRAEIRWLVQRAEAVRTAAAGTREKIGAAIAADRWDMAGTLEAEVAAQRPVEEALVHDLELFTRDVGRKFGFNVPTAV